MVVPTFKLSSGSIMPVIGIGTFAAEEEKELEEALDTAFKIGYRHIDTAHLYRNEHLIGKILKKWFDSGKLKREDIFITTKLPGSGLHPDKVETYLKESLRNLQLDYVDLYLIHYPMRTTEPRKGEFLFTLDALPTDLIAVWKKLEEQHDLGRIKAIGVSNFNEEQVDRIMTSSRIKPTCNQIELSGYLQQPELVKYCQNKGLVVVSYSSFGNPGINTWLEKQGLPLSPDRTGLLKDVTVKKIADKYNKTPAQILLKFLLQKNIVVIPKSVTPKRVKENFDLFDFSLTQDDIKTMEGLDKGEEGRWNTFTFKQSFADHPEYPFPKPRK